MKSSAFAAFLLVISFAFSTAAHAAFPFWNGAFQSSHHFSELAQSHFVGNWTNVTPLFGKSKKAELKSAFLRLDLRTDGTFTCTYGTKSKQVEEIGTWETSSNGQFLYLKEASGKAVKVAKIASADEESLVLECLQSFGFCQFFNLEMTSLTFIK